MWPRCYFAGRYFAPRYWSQSEGTPPPTPGGADNRDAPGIDSLNRNAAGLDTLNRSAAGISSLNRGVVGRAPNQ